MWGASRARNPVECTAPTIIRRCPADAREGHGTTVEASIFIPGNLLEDAPVAYVGPGRKGLKEGRAGRSDTSSPKRINRGRRGAAPAESSRRSRSACPADSQVVSSAVPQVWSAGRLESPASLPPGRRPRRAQTPKRRRDVLVAFGIPPKKTRFEAASGAMTEPWRTAGHDMTPYVQLTVLFASWVSWRRQKTARLVLKGEQSRGFAIDLHWHDLRHEAGSRWIEAGWPIHYVQQMLGQADLMQTSTCSNATVREALRATSTPVRSSIGCFTGNQFGRCYQSLRSVSWCLRGGPE